MRSQENHRIRAMVFDFDGTLAVLNINFGLMKERVLHWMKGFAIDQGRIKEKYLLEIIDEVGGLLREEKGASEAERFYQGAHRILKEVEFEAAAEGRMIPGSKETLAYLRQKGIKIGIVTRNCEEAVRRVFPNIDAFCDAFVSRNSVKRVKPHPDHLTSVMNALQVSGEETVMVGDHVLDILAGKGVGMRTIGVLTGYIKREEFETAGADYVLKDILEVRQFMEGEP
jgi:phosphoglycolate phosphatase